MAQQKYPDNWDELRRKVYSRDDYTCQDCGTQGGKRGNVEVHAHHITPLSEGGSNKIDNLITLCDSCHNQQHDHDIKGSTNRVNSDNSRSKTGLIAIGISISSAGISLLTPNLLFDLFGSLMGFLMYPVVVVISIASGVFGAVQLLGSIN